MKGGHTPLVVVCQNFGRALSYVLPFESQPGTELVCICEFVAPIDCIEY